MYQANPTAWSTGNHLTLPCSDSLQKTYSKKSKKTPWKFNLVGGFVNQAIWKILTSKWVKLFPKFSGMKIPNIFQLPPPSNIDTNKLLIVWFDVVYLVLPPSMEGGYIGNDQAEARIVLEKVCPALNMAHLYPFLISIRYTPKTNMSTENQWLVQMYFLLKVRPFLGSTFVRFPVFFNFWDVGMFGENFFRFKPCWYSLFCNNHSFRRGTSCWYSFFRFNQNQHPRLV